MVSSFLLCNPNVENQRTLEAFFLHASMEVSDHQSTQSAALIGFNDDLLTVILLRLPADSIIRFKSVSKHWQWLLSQEHFIRMHDQLSKSPGFFCLQCISSVWQCVYVSYDVENRSTPPFRCLDSYFDHSCVRIVQSCNGLLLLRINRGSNGVRKYYVFNPTTKQLALIPPVPGGLEVGKTIRFMGLAFHQKDCVHYKLVCVRHLEPDGDLFQIDVYSSYTRKWKICTESFYTGYWPCFSMGVYWNGAIHWDPSYHNHFYFKIKAVHLQVLPVPKEMKPFITRTVHFGECRGHLHLILGNDYGETSLHMNVYEMLSDHSGWFVKYQVHLDALPRAFPEMFRLPCTYDFSVIDVVRGEEEEDAFMVLRIHRKIVTYNLHDKSFKQTSSLTKPFCGVFHRYTETLGSF